MIKQALAAKAAIKAMNDEAERTGKVTVASSAAEAAGRRDATKATQDGTTAAKDATRAVEDEGASADRMSKKILDAASKTSTAVRATRDLSSATKDAARDANKLASGTGRVEQSMTRAQRVWSSFTSALRNSKADRTDAASGIGKIADKLKEIGEARPEIVPSFAALIPVVSALLALIGPALSGVGALGIAVLGLGANIASAAASAVVALPAIGGLLTLLGTAKLATAGVGDALKAGEAARAPGASAADLAKYKQALDVLSPSARTFVEWTSKMSGAFTALRKQVQERFFAGFAGDLHDVNGLLPVVQVGLSGVAGAMGRVVGYLLQKISSPAWASDLRIFFAAIAGDVPIVGRGLGSVLDIVRNLSVVALPFLRDFASMAADAAAHVSDLVQAGRNSGALEAFLQRSENRLMGWLHIASNLGTVLLNYGRLAAPLGDETEKALGSLTAEWKSASESALGPNSSFRTYIAQIQPLLKQLGGVIKDSLSFLGKEFTDPQNIQQMTELVKVIRTQLGPALGSLIDTLAKSGIAVQFAKALGAIALAIQSLLANGGVQGLKAFWTIVEGLATAFSAVVRSPIGSFLSNILVPPLVVLAGLATPLALVLKVLRSIIGLKSDGSGLTGLVNKIKGIGGGTAAAEGADAAEGAAAGGGAAAGVGAAGLLATVLPLIALPVAGLIMAAQGANTKTGTSDADIKDTLNGLKSTSTQASTRTVARGRVIGTSGSTAGALTRLAAEGGKSAGADGGFSNYVGALDKQLTQLVQSGNGEKAQSIIDGLGISAKTAAIDFPKFTSAVQNNGKAVKNGSGLWKNYEDTAVEAGQAQADANTSIKNSAALFDASAKAAKNHKASFDADTQAGRDNRTAFENSMGAIRNASDALVKNGASTQQAKAYTLAHIRTLQQAALAAGANKKQIEELTAKLYGIPPHIITQVEVEKAAADAALSALQKKLNDLANNPTYHQLYIEQTTIQGGGGGGENGYLSKGGPVYRAGGGSIPSYAAGTDTVPTMLSEGEWILPKRLVDKIGTENLRMLTTGAQSFVEMLRNVTSAEPKPVPYMPQYARAGNATVPMLHKAPTAVSESNQLIGRDLVINYPKPERATDALPREIRKLAYLRKGR